MAKLEQIQKIGTDSVVQRVLDQITQWIIAGKLTPGDQIPTEFELSQSLGVSRNSVREAIKILVYLGVLEIRRAEGTFVCSGASVRMFNPLLYQIILSAGSSQRDVMQIREMIETGVVELALHQGTEEDLVLLREKLEELGKKIDGGCPIDDVFRADVAFHDVICQMTHNPLVQNINDTVNIITHQIRYQTVAHLMTTETLREKFFDAHRRLFELISQKNAAGESVGAVVRGTYNLPYLKGIITE